MQRIIRYGAWAAIAVLAITIALVLGLPKSPPMVSGEPFGVPFELVDDSGEPITDAAFRGQPSAVFFGFTHCPDVCPTTLYDLTRWIDELGPAGEVLKAYFVTVDPARDTPESLRIYVSNFSNSITGISGEPADVDRMLDGFGVYFKRVPTDDGYTMDHTASVFLLDAEGRLRSTIAYEEDEAVALAKLRNLVK